jgi:hypothetical protein
MNRPLDSGTVAVEFSHHFPGGIVTVNSESGGLTLECASRVPKLLRGRSDDFRPDIVTIFLGAIAYSRDPDRRMDGRSNDIAILALGPRGTRSNFLRFPDRFPVDIAPEFRRSLIDNFPSFRDTADGSMIAKNSPRIKR